MLTGLEREVNLGKDSFGHQEENSIYQNVYITYYIAFWTDGP
jgi:hypothetical protein